MIIKGLPDFASEQDKIKFLVENKDIIVTQAKSTKKEADGFGHYPIYMREGVSNKSLNQDPEYLVTKDVIEVKTIINTTNLLDSHLDVHIDGLWKKSLKESGSRLLHVQEHKSNEFNKIISSGQDLEAYTKKYKWRDLGIDFDGATEALEFNSKIRKSRNSYMHEQYARKYVTNHSVGMHYDKVVLCVDDKDYGEENENYKTYAQLVANQNALGKYFWAVLEAKAIEGSAVPNGSNWATPTTSIKSIEDSQREIKNKAILKWLKS